MNIGFAIRKNRLERGLTFAGLSEKSGVAIETIGRLERRGEINVELATLELLAAGLGMQVWELIREAENE